MRIAISGATGFIGKELVSVLKEQDELLIITSRNNLDDLKLFEDLDYCSIHDKEKLMLKMENVDVLIHLAAQRPIKGAPEEFSDYMGNVEMMTELLSLCVKTNVSKLVNISTKAVYGLPGDTPFSEESKLKPATFYGLSKLMAEDACNFYSAKFNLKCINLRLGQVIGWGEKNQNMFTVCLNKALNKQEQTVWGNGVGKREYIYVKDVVCAIQKAIGFDGSDTFNIAWGNPIAHIDMAKTINNVFKNTELKCLTDKVEDKTVETIDISKARSVLNWQPQFESLEEALLDMKREYETGTNII